MDLVVAIDSSGPVNEVMREILLTEVRGVTQSTCASTPPWILAPPLTPAVVDPSGPLTEAGFDIPCPGILLAERRPGHRGRKDRIRYLKECEEVM